MDRRKVAAKKIARGRPDVPGKGEGWKSSSVAMHWTIIGFQHSEKISITPTKSLMNQRDLAVAYSLDVAYACCNPR